MEIIRSIASPHFDERKNGAKPVFLLMHYTTLGAAETAHVFTGKSANPAGQRVSAHYMIDEQGGVTQFVDEGKRAWHAGIAHWEGNEDINSASIGIELVNPGHERGYRSFPALQMAALIALSREIVERHKIAPHHILGHSDVAPSRKKDPGELFDWKMLAAKGVGAWPQPNSEHYDLATKYLNDMNFVKGQFSRYGYNASESLPVLVSAFQRHFVPEVFNDRDQIGSLDRDTLARLMSLNDQKS